MEQDPERTPLDAAHADMMRDPDDEAARLQYYARLADGMLFVMLEAEPEGGVIQPLVMELEDGPLVLAFDSEDRLAEAAGAPVPYAELPGRVIVGQLAGQGVTLGINLGVAESAFLVSPDALNWLSTTLIHTPDEIAARPIAFEAPRGLPDRLIRALDVKLARAGALASTALLAAVRYDDGRHGHMLAFVGVVSGAEAALARAAGEALTFSGIEVGEMDVTFMNEGEPAHERMARVALRIDLPKKAVTAPTEPQAPGMDPDKPPKLV